MILWWDYGDAVGRPSMPGDARRRVPSRNQLASSPRALSLESHRLGSPENIIQYNTRRPINSRVSRASRLLSALARAISAACFRACEPRDLDPPRRWRKTAERDDRVLHRVPKIVSILEASLAFRFRLRIVDEEEETWKSRNSREFWSAITA